MTSTYTRRGTIYLLHFDRPYKHARHYLGWASDLEARLAAHSAGHGARLLEVARQHGIGWTLARTWPGTRVRERQIKNQGGASRCCPACGIHPPQRVWETRELTTIARRFFGLIDGDWITNRAALTYARRRITARLAHPTTPITPGELLGWSERTPTMADLRYSPTYVRADGSVWCVQEDTETGTENACRMVIDTETGLSLFLPDYLVNTTAAQPTSRVTGQVWPLFRWATRTDLPTTHTTRR
jgi:predicted GIY-YIG superfamily endonuclease